MRTVSPSFLYSGIARNLKRKMRVHKVMTINPLKNHWFYFVVFVYFVVRKVLLQSLKHKRCS